MIKTLIGIILLLIPFLLINSYGNKKKAFIIILSASIGFHLLLATITQALHIFYYPVVAGITGVFALFVIFRHSKRKAPLLKFKSMDWVSIVVMGIAILNLYQVHFNYSGEYASISNPHRYGEHIQYPYPYFADEWYAAAIIDEVVNFNALPINYPLLENLVLENLQIPFHSTIAGMFLLLDLDPIRYYTTLAIFSGTLLCFLIYVLLRIKNISRLCAAVVALSALYITNGANLPGIWNLIPVNLGIITLLISFMLLMYKEKQKSLLVSILVLLFYPPFILFYGIAYFLFLLEEKEKKKKERKEHSISTGLKDWIMLTSIVVLIALAASTILYSTGRLNITFLKEIWSTRILYSSFTNIHIPQFSPLAIIPIPLLALSAVGIVCKAKKEKMLLSTLLICSVYWIAYSFITFRVLIGYERIVFLGSIFVVVFAGFGIEWMYQRLKGLRFLRSTFPLTSLLIIILVFFALSSSDYTTNEKWKELKLINKEDGTTYLPAPPANQYLHPDDIQLFRNLKNAIFLAPPWKGTVIGTTTDAQPITIKPGTITHNRGLFTIFMLSTCEERKAIIEEKEIEYLYVPQIECKGLEFISRSSEGLYLYKVIDEDKEKVEN